MVPILLTWLLFHAAALSRSPVTVKALIDAGANFEARDANGWTPLHWAVGSQSSDVVEALIDAGADLEARDANGWTPLHRAAEYGKSLNGLRVVLALIFAGANINARDNNGLTPLHNVAGISKGDISSTSVVESMIRAGADIEARTTEHGLTPLMFAVLATLEAKEPLENLKSGPHRILTPLSQQGFSRGRDWGIRGFPAVP